MFHSLIMFLKAKTSLIVPQMQQIIFWYPFPQPDSLFLVTEKAEIYKIRRLLPVSIQLCKSMNDSWHNVVSFPFLWVWENLSFPPPRHTLPCRPDGIVVFLRHSCLQNNWENSFCCQILLLNKETLKSSRVITQLKHSADVFKYLRVRRLCTP